MMLLENPIQKTTYEAAIFASDSWRKTKSGNGIDPNVKKLQEVSEPTAHNQDIEEGEEESDSDSRQQMVDGIFSSGPKESYELPSPVELIQLAFAGDDVAEEFEKDKQEILNEGNPEPDKPVLLPGWGQWTDVQEKKKDLPSWMLKEHEDAKRKREEILKRRMHILIMSLSPKRWIKRLRSCKQKLCPTPSHPRNFLNKVRACQLDLNETQRLQLEV
ncbi:U3 small nucleolar RNA-associated protein 14-like [Hibiscus syriacus]|uniref:U3 small nucleolar RNA-associated protein 14-like n=1 Tax=Hibiscus syriacus TaxID=106335 RepID=UPI0019229558|nr:U3 small nucleolar RNA-associated protein 14-like [Hibiscus syriacus]